MRPTRRDMMFGAAAFAATPAFAAEEPSPTILRAVPADLQLLPEGYGESALWTYGGSIPGVEIRVRQNDRVRRRLVNDLSQRTSTHWHGVRVVNAMDGVAGLTQPAVEPGGYFDYDFIVPDAGTFWYHAHFRAFEQVGRGLYGALIVEEADAIDADRDQVVVIDDWLVDPDTARLAGEFGSPHDLSHAGRLGNYFTSNGEYDLTLTVKRHERLRLRLINAANSRIFELRLHGLEGWVIAEDGMPLTQPRPATGPFLLAPGQRADLLVDVTADAGETAHLVRMDGSDDFSQVAFSVENGGTRHRRGEPAPLPPSAHVVPDISQATPLKLRMEGGAMGGMRHAMMGGQKRSMRELAATGQFWAFNGSIGTMDEHPFADISLGETVHLGIANDTVFPHAMHLHGMHFHEIEADGQLGPRRDTTLLLRGETREIAFVADNPGDWLLHCHMLSHAASGMLTWVRIT